VTAPFTVEVRYIIHCSRCAADEVEMFYVPQNHDLPWPTIPQGWQAVNGMPICPRHEVMSTFLTARLPVPRPCCTRTSSLSPLLIFAETTR
jgi:hypothetical protein